MGKTEAIVAVLLGFGMFVSAFLSLLSYSQTKARGQAEIGLKEGERSELLQSVNKSRTEERIIQERWWAEQLGILRGELEAERRESAALRDDNTAIYSELDQIKSFFAGTHRRWDDKAKRELEKLGGHIEEPPLLTIHTRRSSDRVTGRLPVD